MFVRLACPEAGAPCWSEQHAPDHHKGDTAGDPDAGGRAGGLTAAADALSWHSLPCDAGSVWLFNGLFLIHTFTDTPNPSFSPKP